MNPKGSRLGFGLGVFGVALLHFVASFFVAFAAGVSSSQPLKIASNILTFPLSLLPNTVDLPGLAGWLPLVLLSLAWGMAICFGVRALAHRPRS